MIPSRPSLPRIISRMLGPADIAGIGRTTRVPVGSDDPQALGQVGDIPVTVGLHPGGAGRDPAAERGVGERVGDVPERESVGSKLVLQSRAENAGLDASQARCPVDLQHGVQAREVDRDDGTRLGRFGLQRTRDRRPSPERDHHRVVGDRRVQNGADLRLARRAHDDIRDPRQVTSSLPDQVPQRLAATVHDSVERVGRDVLRPELRSPTLRAATPSASTPESAATRSSAPAP